MNKALLAARVAACLGLGVPQLASANPSGLYESVWYNIPEYDYSPTQDDVSLEQVYTAGQTPAYTFLNSVDGFDYGSVQSDIGSTIAQWFGSDASGPAASDTTDPYDGFFAFNAYGYINVTTAGFYTFNLGNTFNQIDDAARVFVDGDIVAEQNFDGTFPDYQSSVYLTLGLHPFDLFYFQTEGGYGLSLDATDASGGAIAYVAGGSPVTPPPVPEPASWALLILGVGAVGAMTRRRQGAAAA